ncbi:hypothetical protein [Aeromonas sp. 601027]|uniref:hypothetical protein n=1 Tax=Aeromonas TaxID=642 RepID=UPI003B9EA2C2
MATELRAHADTTKQGVIFYPFHVFSDEFPIVVLALATKKKLSVISDVSKDTWSSKWGQAVSQFRSDWISDLDLYNPFELSENDAAKNIRKIIGECKNDLCDFALFPDALPEYTVRLRGAHTYKKSTIFERRALLHSGGFVFPRLMKKDILPYYVYVEGFKLKLRIFPLIDKGDVGDKLPFLIECVIKEKSEQWMLWHFPSFYYFNG